MGDRQRITQISYVDASSSIETQLDTKITESAVDTTAAAEADIVGQQLPQSTPGLWSAPATDR